MNNTLFNNIYTQEMTPHDMKVDYIEEIPGM